MMEDPKVGVEKKTSMAKNIGGTRNTALLKAIGSTTNQKIMVNGPVLHQEVQEALSCQARDTETRS